MTSNYIYLIHKKIFLSLQFEKKYIFILKARAKKKSHHK